MTTFVTPLAGAVRLRGAVCLQLSSKSPPANAEPAARIMAVAIAALFMRLSSVLPIRRIGRKVSEALRADGGWQMADGGVVHAICRGACHPPSAICHRAKRSLLRGPRGDRLHRGFEAARARLRLLRAFERLDVFALMCERQFLPAIPRRRLRLQRFHEIRGRLPLALLGVEIEPHFDRLVSFESL